MTDAELQAHRAERAAAVRAALGLAQIPPADWTHDQRLRYNQELAAVILADPYATPQEKATASGIAAKTHDPLEPYKITEAISDFFVGAAEGVGGVVQSVAAVGEGVKNTLTTTKWLIPVAAVVAVVVLLSSFARRTGATR